ncbi:MAG: hypothetical protein KJ061_17315 [Vicinamibacteraceae bacterium]|nr:hypothetical protein [Vicinamibacteraceae bacterium]
MCSHPQNTTGRHPARAVSLAVEHLADDEAALAEALAAALADAEAYRTVACAAIERLHDLEQRLCLARTLHARMRDELRRYTAVQVRPAEAA